MVGTIITGNHKPNDFYLKKTGTLVDERTASRMRGTYECLVVKGPDRRQKR
jgi:hypothetical protein